jgi:hypothetical protein
MSDFTNHDRESLLKEIQLGLDADRFLSTPLGKYLLMRAQEEAIESMDKLKTMTVCPDNLDDVRNLQCSIKWAENFEFWLTEQIEAAHNLERILIESESTD